MSSKSETRKSQLDAKGAAHPGKNGSTKPLLVEIGCEEIPARFLDSARQDFGRALGEALKSANFLEDVRAIQTYSTPRRLIAYAPAVAEKQPDKTDEILGPPVKVSYDAQGQPTKAATSFAEKNSAKVSDLIRVTTPKGEYLAVRRAVRGQPARELLSGLVTGAIASLSFPKNMYWVAKSGPYFVRPVRWILALFGEGAQARVVPVEFAGVKSGDATYGHRAYEKRPLRVRGFDDFAATLRQAKVEIDGEKRRQMVKAGCKALLEDSQRRVEDPDLETWIVNSTEWPSALRGGFDPRFLHLPREVLVTVMRDHQKYFAVEDRQGRLQPRFIAILNMGSDPKGLIRAGHERVLAARFTDAEFFWDADQKLPLSQRPEMLAGVLYQTELGSYAEKVRRMTGLAQEICAQLSAAGGATRDNSLEHAARAVELCKCDLTTNMVREFTELQGVVGGLYARAQGEPEAVADAIYDHYRPESLEDSVPRSLAGAVVSLADKVDSVAGGFSVGLEPTGSSDPFALRRQANGAIKILVELSLSVSLRRLIERDIEQLNVEWKKPQVEVFAAIVSFFEDRLRYYLEEVRKLRYDTVRAVLKAGWDVPVDALRRAEALEKLRDTADFAALAIAAKRIKNILAKSASADDWRPGDVDTARLENGPEKELYENFGAVAAEVEPLRSTRSYEEALKTIARLRRPVDTYFDKVLVMAEDRAVRENRLRLMGQLDQLFSGIAHFAEVVSARREVDASTGVKAGL